MMGVKANDELTKRRAGVVPIYMVKEDKDLGDLDKRLHAWSW